MSKRRRRISVPDDCRIHSYRQLVDVLRRRRHELRMSQLEVDDRAGLHTGYTGKIEAHVRKLGPVSFTLLLQTLGVSVVVLTDDGEVLLAEPESHLPHGRTFERGDGLTDGQTLWGASV